MSNVILESKYDSLPVDIKNVTKVYLRQDNINLWLSFGIFSHLS